MLLANRMASNFSSWEVASVDRKELNWTVLERRGFEDAALDRNLFPYLLGFLGGIATLRPAGLVLKYLFQRAGPVWSMKCALGKCQMEQEKEERADGRKYNEIWFWG